jgi:hypothetical protein
MESVPGGGKKNFAADFCSNLYGKRVQSADRIIQNYRPEERHLGNKRLNRASQGSGGPVVTLDDDGTHSRISRLTRRAQAIQSAGHAKISRRRHVRAEVNVHIDGSVHHFVNHRAKIFWSEHGLSSFLLRLFRVFCK